MLCVYYNKFYIRLPVSKYIYMYNYVVYHCTEEVYTEYQIPLKLVLPLFSSEHKFGTFKVCVKEDGFVPLMSCILYMYDSREGYH